MDTFLGCDAIQNVSDFGPERCDAAFGGLARQGLEFGEEFLDGIEVWRIRRQMDEPGTSRFDGAGHAGDFVAAQVVGDDEVAGLERWAQELFHVGEKHHSVHRPIGGHGRGQLVVPRSGDEGRGLPVPVGNRRDTASASICSSMAPRRACLVEEHQMSDVERGLILSPFKPRLLHVWPLLLAGVKSFFYSSSPICSAGATTRES